MYEYNYVTTHYYSTLKIILLFMTIPMTAFHGNYFLCHYTSMCCKSRLGSCIIPEGFG